MNATPAATRRAKAAMADTESYIRDVVHQLRELGLLDHHPEIAALADEAKAQVESLRKARISL